MRGLVIDVLRFLLIRAKQAESDPAVHGKAVDLLERLDRLDEEPEVYQAAAEPEPPLAKK